jgi:hypothetical protein
MKQTLAAVALIAATATAWAGPSCSAPKDRWIS